MFNFWSILCRPSFQAVTLDNACEVVDNFLDDSV